MKLWFVCPAWKRYGITEFVFAQRRRLLDRLTDAGLESYCVVPTDDDNAEIAERHGFTVIPTPNKLGLRFNNGTEHALRDGADLICLTGSDDWVHEDYFEGIGTDKMRGGWPYAIVDRNGGKMAEVRVSYNGGGGPWVLPAWLFEHAPRPFDDGQMSGILATAYAALLPPIEYHFANPCQLVGFQSDVQMNEYEKVVRAWADGSRERAPFPRLREFYDDDLVDMAKAYYGAPEREGWMGRARIGSRNGEQPAIDLSGDPNWVSRQPVNEVLSARVVRESIPVSRGGKVVEHSVRGTAVVYVARDGNRLYKDIVPLARVRLLPPKSVDGAPGEHEHQADDQQDDAQRP